eukprot:9027315-Pyramimonas_sp.AAC.1
MLQAGKEGRADCRLGGCDATSSFSLTFEQSHGTLARALSLFPQAGIRPVHLRGSRREHPRRVFRRARRHARPA